MRLSPIVLLALFAGGCANVHFPYVINVQQGNAVTPEMVAKLKPGMSRAQVRFILGTPLTVDLFRADRWDYVYEFHKAGVLTEKRRVSVFFKGDALERVEQVGMGKEAAVSQQQTASPARPAATPEEVPGNAATTVVAPMGTPSDEKTPAPAKENSAPLQLTPATTLNAPAAPSFPVAPETQDSGTPTQAQ